MRDPGPCLEAVGRLHRLDRWCLLPTERLRPEERVRELCAADLCGNWGKHPQCPPRVGSLAQAGALFDRAREGLLLQTTYLVDPTDREAVRETRRLFAEALLAVEAAFARKGAERPYALVGGPCALCGPGPCPAKEGTPCPSPERARPSLEALGVDVVALQEAVGWDAAFHTDRVSWTGALLLFGGPSDSPDQ